MFGDKLKLLAEQTLRKQTIADSTLATVVGQSIDAKWVRSVASFVMAVLS